MVMTKSLKFSSLHYHRSQCSKYSNCLLLIYFGGVGCFVRFRIWQSCTIILLYEVPGVFSTLLSLTDRSSNVIIFAFCCFSICSLHIYPLEWCSMLSLIKLLYKKEKGKGKFKVWVWTPSARPQRIMGLFYQLLPWGWR